MAKRDNQEDRLCYYIGKHLPPLLPSGVWFSHMPMGENRDMRTGAKLKRWGSKAGTPDYLFIYQGRPLFIECKSDRGTLNKNQKIQFPIIEESGAPIKVVRDFDGLLQALIAHGIPVKTGVYA